MDIDLEDFTAPPAPPPPPVSSVDAAQVEAEKSAAYERGYSAGFDDAVKAEADNQARIGAEFASHLQDMSFTFHEARAHVLEAVQPLLQELADTFLPEQVKSTMEAWIVETIQPLIEQAADQPIVIAVAPGGRETLAPYIDSAIAAVVRLDEEPTLTDGQAFIRLGQVERKVDLDAALAQFRSSLNALSELNGKALKHG
jgi:flagellar assembly protein FliH